jgi:hypothetical protein
MTPPSELNTIGRLRPFKVSSRSRNRRSTCGPSNIPSAAIHSLQPGPQASRSPLARKKIIGSGFGCARVPCKPMANASAVAVPAKTKRAVLMGIFLAPLSPRIEILWVVATRSPLTPAAVRGEPRSGRAADETC